jgi:ABC-type phosphate transport system substrate-binding protein
MRMLSKLLAGAAAVAATVTLAAGPALADPPTPPRNSDVVGVGSDTIQFVMDQLSHDYNKAHHGASTLLYSWDAVPQGSTITEKAGGVGGDCTVIRPTGSGAGISALEANAAVTGGTGFCVDFARSSRGRATTDPSCTASGGICFVSLGGDAVTWAARSAAAGGTNAPAELTLAELKAIYLCQDTKWTQVGGTSTATIHPYLPQTSSGTRAFFLTALGGGTPITPGSCVSDDNNTLIENEGVAPVLNDVNGIFPYSVADFIAQVYHSAQCTVSGCNYPNAPTCTPTSKQNLFGCDLHGVLTLEEVGNASGHIDKTSKPTKPWPLTTPPCGGTTGVTCPTININFNSAFQRTVYDVVRTTDGGTADNIPAYLEPFFAASTAATPGYTCGTSGSNDLKKYGFLPIASCGTAS